MDEGSQHSKRQKLSPAAQKAEDTHLAILLATFQERLDSELCAPLETPTQVPGSRQTAADLLHDAASRWHTMPEQPQTDGPEKASSATRTQLSSLFVPMLIGLQKEAEALQDMLDLHSLPQVPNSCKVEPTLENAKRIATYAHKLSYTTFAPTVVLGQPLFRPPAPQSSDFRASLLHQCARAVHSAVAPDIISAQAKPEPAARQVAAEGMAAGGTESKPAEAVPVIAEPQPQPNPPADVRAPYTHSAFDFILNPDLEEVDEEFSSSEDHMPQKRSFLGFIQDLDDTRAEVLQISVSGPKKVATVPWTPGYGTAAQWVDTSTNGQASRTPGRPPAWDPRPAKPLAPDWNPAPPTVGSSLPRPPPAQMAGPGIRDRSAPGSSLPSRTQAVAQGEHPWPPGGVQQAFPRPPSSAGLQGPVRPLNARSFPGSQAGQPPEFMPLGGPPQPAPSLNSGQQLGSRRPQLQAGLHTSGQPQQIARPQGPPPGGILPPRGLPQIRTQAVQAARSSPMPSSGPLAAAGPPSTSQQGGISSYGALPHIPGPPGPGIRPPGAPLQAGPARAQQPPFRGGPLPDKSGPSSSRIDPASMPRPLPRPDEPQEFPTRQDGKPMLPLPADYPIIVHDMGNCSPRNMRLTLNCVPSTSDLLQQSNMPLAVLIQPLAPTQPGEPPLQVVDMGEAGPLRCGNCKAYINPFMRFSDYGRKFTCNFCQAVNPTPHDYVENVGPDGRRRDADERPELSKGSVEFAATSQFMVRPPMPPIHFFLIEVSHTAVTSGATAAACSSIARVLDDIQGQDSARVGIATFNSTVHFYALRASQSQPQMLVVPDADEPYHPLPGSLLAPLRESRSLIDTLLEQVPRMFADTQILDSCGTAAIEACASALKAGVGGKLHAFITALPKVGTKALGVRDPGGRTNEKEPLKTMEPAMKEYRELAESAAEGMVSIDLFLLAHSFVDVATLGILTHITSGQLYLYQPFKQDLHADEFFNDLRWNIVRPQGWEAVGRLRVSEGLVIERYLGPHYRRTMTDLDLPAVHADSSIAAQLRHSDRLADNKEAYLQFALLYTDCQGNRRIRVHTIGLPVTSVMGTIFRGADADSQVNYLARSMAFQVPGGKLGAIRDQAYKNAVDVLFTYRSKCASASASGQLILPESLKLLPLYALALTKTHAFRSDTRADVRATWLMRLLSLKPERTLPLIYPRLFALGSLLSSAVQDPSQLALPPAIYYLSAAKLADDGIFLLENGFEAFLQFGERVPPDLMTALLGVPSLDMLPRAVPNMLGLPVFDTPPSRSLHTLVDIVRRQRGRFLPLQVMPHVPAHMSPFYTSLIEDKVEGMSYVEHLCAVHRDIQRKFA